MIIKLLLEGSPREESILFWLIETGVLLDNLNNLILFVGEPLSENIFNEYIPALQKIVHYYLELWSRIILELDGS